MTYRNKDYLALAKGKPCVHCGVSDGTIVSCHYSGMLAGTLGKGLGQKPHDFCVAHLCFNCHNDFDSFKTENDDKRAAMFMLQILKTMAILLETGEIEVVTKGCVVCNDE
jgi:hypothetical protein